MATLTTTPIKVFVSGETVTPTKLNELSQSTVALTAGTIVAADLASDAVTNVKIASGVDASKLTTGTLPIARIADAAITAAKLDGAQTGSAPIYGCRAWVNFDAKRDASGASNTSNTSRFIRGSGNVASVLRTGLGEYTITFATAMPSANYAVVASGDHAPSASRGTNYETMNLLAGSFKMVVGFSNSATNGGLFDTEGAHVAVFA